MKKTFEERLFLYIEGNAQELYTKMQGTESEVNVYKALISILSAYPRYVLEPFTDWLLERINELQDMSAFTVPTSQEQILSVYYILGHLNADLLQHEAIPEDFVASQVLDKFTATTRKVIEVVIANHTQEEVNSLLYQLKLANDKEIKELINIMFDKIKKVEETANDAVQGTSDTTVSANVAEARQETVAVAIEASTANAASTVDAATLPTAEADTGSIEQTVNTETAVPTGELKAEDTSATVVAEAVMEEVTNGNDTTGVGVPSEELGAETTGAAEAADSHTDESNVVQADGTAEEVITQEVSANVNTGETPASDGVQGEAADTADTGSGATGGSTGDTDVVGAGDEILSASDGEKDSSGEERPVTELGELTENKEEGDQINGQSDIEVDDIHTAGVAVTSEEGGDAGSTAEAGYSEQGEGLVQETAGDGAAEADCEVIQEESPNESESYDNGGVGESDTDGGVAAAEERSDAGDTGGLNEPSNTEGVLPEECQLATPEDKGSTGFVNVLGEVPEQNEAALRDYILSVAKAAISERLNSAFTPELEDILVNYAKDELKELISETVEHIVTRSIK